MQGTNENRKNSANGLKTAAIIIILVAVVGIAAILIFVAGGINGGGQNSAYGSSAEANNEIVTPVGKLTYPEEWAESVKVEEKTSGGTYSAKFVGSVGKDKVVLFEVVVGENGSGYQIGTLPDDEGNAQRVWINISTIEAKSSWSEEDISNINLMQSCVNDIIEQINSIDGFKAA